MHHLLSSPKMLYAYIAVILLAETAAIALLKAYADTSNILFLFGGLFGYFLVCVFLEYSFRYEGMGVVNILWSAFSVTFVVATGMLLFSEHVTPAQIVGTAFVMTGVLLLRWSEARRPPLIAPLPSC